MVKVVVIIPLGSTGAVPFSLVSVITLVQNDTIRVASLAIDTVTVVSIDSASLSIVSQIAVATNISIGDNVVINDTIPKNILQKDFLSSIVKLFNLYIYEDRNIERHVIIKPYIDFYTGSQVNWSDKVSRDNPIRLTPMAQLQNIILRTNSV